MRAVKNKLSKFENMRALDPVVGCVPPGSPSDSWEKAKKKSNSIDTLKKHMTMRGLWPRSASSEKWEGGEFSRNVPRDLIVTKRDIVGEREGASVIAFAHSDRRRRVVDRKSEKKYSDSDVIRSLFTFRAIFFLRHAIFSASFSPDCGLAWQFMNSHRPFATRVALLNRDVDWLV